MTPARKSALAAKQAALPKGWAVDEDGHAVDPHTVQIRRNFTAICRAQTALFTARQTGNVDGSIKAESRLEMLKTKRALLVLAREAARGV